MYTVHYPYQEDQGLGIASEWITGGFSTLTSLIGGSQAKKQTEREKELLLLQQQIAAQNNQSAWELEQLKFQNLTAQNQLNQVNMNPDNSMSGNNTSLIVGGILLLAVGTAVAVSISRPKETALNGLLETIG